MGHYLHKRVRPVPLPRTGRRPRNAGCPVGAPRSPMNLIETIVASPSLRQVAQRPLLSTLLPVQRLPEPELIQASRRAPFRGGSLPLDQPGDRLCVHCETLHTADSARLISMQLAGVGTLR